MRIFTLLLTLVALGAMSAGAQQPQRVSLPLLAGGRGTTPTPPDGAAVRAVNAPYFQVADVNEKFSELGIFWFGKVTPNANSTDVRIGYNDQELFVYVAVIDRRLWYEESAQAAATADLAAWDSVELLIDTAGRSAAAPRASSHRLIAGFSGPPSGAARESYERASRGDGSAWQTASTAFTTVSGWRGSELNSDLDSKGWVMTFRVPFSSLGASKPSDGAAWALGVRINDRDLATGAPGPVSLWPEQSAPDAPASWGELRFGLPTYTPPASQSPSEVTIRQGGGISTPDGMAGGGFSCGGSLDYWSAWGEANHDLLENGDPRGDFNIQNQADISDYPCFSRYYISFPLDSLPEGKVIRSAKVVLHQFSNATANRDDPNPENWTKPSLIQAHRASAGFDEASLSWNNAPQPLENLGGTWVQVLLETAPFPGIAYEWDVSDAMADAYATDTPLHLAFYSADSGYHSGKYFVSADTGDWNAAGRPTLVVTLGDPAP